MGTVRTESEPSGLPSYNRNMSALKDEVRQLLDRLPEEASLEDIQYQIYVRQRIKSGLDDVEAGRVLGEEEVERRLATWTQQ